MGSDGTTQVRRASSPGWFRCRGKQNGEMGAEHDAGSTVITRNCWGSRYAHVSSPSLCFPTQSLIFFLGPCSVAGRRDRPGVLRCRGSVNTSSSGAEQQFASWLLSLQEAHTRFGNRNRDLAAYQRLGRGGSDSEPDPRFSCACCQVTQPRGISLPLQILL